MLFPKLVLSGLGVVAFAGVAYKFIPANSSNNNSGTTENSDTSRKTATEEINHSYLLVTTSVADTTKSETTTDLIKTDTSKKNYFCSFEGNSSNEIIKDETCEIYDLNKETTTNEKLIDLYKLTTSPSKHLTTTKPASNKQYILKIDSKKYAKIKTENKNIEIIKSETNKQFIKLTENYKLTNENGKFKTNIVLAKITAQPASTNTNPYKCKFNATDTQTHNCKIYGFSTQPTITAGETNLSTSHLSAASSSNISNNNYVLIHFEDENIKKTEKEFRTTNPVVYPTTDGNVSSTAYLTTKYVNSYVGTINATPTNSQLLKVKQSPADFLIVVKSLESANPATTQMKTGSNGSKTKNYTCQLTISSSLINDSSCSLVKLTKEENKSVHINSTETELENKDHFTQNTFFKLIVNNNQMIQHSYGDQESDYITINSTADSGKSYGKVKVVAKYLYEKPISKTKWLLVKSKANSNNLSTFNDLKCKLLPSDQLENCSVYKITGTIDSNNPYNKINLTNANTAITATNDIAENSYVIVKLTTEKNTENLSNELSLHKADNNEVNKYEVISPIFTLDDGSLTNEKSMFLK